MSGFASDNYAGAHPAVLEAVMNANAIGHVRSYGDDPITEHAVSLFKREFGERAEVFITFNGTGANVVGLASLLRPWEAVICATTSHINVDECGAPEKFLGSKLIDLETPDGKLTPELANSAYEGIGFVHHVQPRVILVTQSTELGTVYTPDELSALTAYAHAREMFVYLDGARIANAAAALGVSFAELVVDTGIDALSFGGTKNAGLGAEAVVILNPALAVNTGYIRKQSMQLSSKMRFMSAQFVAQLESDLWHETASHANEMARLLADSVRGIPNVTITQPVQANGVFAVIPREITEELSDRYPFYVWNESTNEVRWMCSWDTTPEDVHGFAAALTSLASASSK